MTFASPRRVRRRRCCIIHESCFNFGSTAAPFCCRLPTKASCIKPTLITASVGSLDPNLPIWAGGACRIDPRKLKPADFWGKAKNGSYIKTSAMTESLVKLSQNCIKGGKALEALERKTTFLTGTATQFVSCWTEFLMQLMQMNKQLELRWH